MRSISLLSSLILAGCVAIVQVDPAAEDCGEDVTVFTPVTGVTTVSECEAPQN